MRLWPFGRAGASPPTRGTAFRGRAALTPGGPGSGLGGEGGFGRGLPGGMGGPWAYEAADMLGAETAEWLPWIRSPDGEINADRDIMVARSRDLCCNDGWAKGALTRVLDNTVGHQFRLVARPNHRALAAHGRDFDATWAHEFGRAAEAEWSLWADDPLHHCDATRSLSMTQMFRLSLAHQLKDGECLGLLLWAPERIGPGAARYATVLQLINPDRLSNPQQVMDTQLLRGGVELDELGAPVAYHIRRGHQADWFDAQQSMQWDRFPRETAWGRPIVAHQYEREDIGQHRGLGVFTPVLSRFRMLARYDRAELQQALLQTVFATFITSPYDADDVQKAMDTPESAEELSAYQQMRGDFHSANPISVNGARVAVLAPGEEPKTVTPSHPNSGFEAFQGAFLRNFAAAVGVSAEQLSLDYSKTNYSSARAAMLEAWKTMLRRRADFATGFANPVFCAFLEEAVDRKRLPLPKGAPSFVEMRAAYARCRWIGPARGWVDPVKERAGALIGLDAGFDTLEQVCAEQGVEYEEVLDQRDVEMRGLEERGLPKPEWAVDALAKMGQDMGEKEGK